MAVNKNNSDIIWAKYVVTKPFLDRLQKDSSLDRLGVRINGEIDLEKVREIFVNSDPNPPTNKKYFEWILLGYIDGGNHLLENVYAHMKNTLNKFKVLVQKKQLPTQLCDLTNYCGLFGCTRKGKEKLGLLNTLSDYPDVESGTAIRRNIKKDADLVYSDQLIKVYHPKTVEAAQLYGSNTRWCTASTSGQNMFDKYNQDGPLYIIIPTKPLHKGEKYQIHFQSISFMNEHDKPISISEFQHYKNSLISFVKTINYKVTASQLYKKMVDTDYGELEWGINDFEQNEQGETVVQEHDIEYKSLPIIEIITPNMDLTDNQDPYSILLNVLTDNYNIVKQLIIQGVNINVVDHRNSNLLFYAQSPEVIKLLVKSGVNINHVNKFSNNPLLINIDKQSDNWKLLLELGANPNIINRESYSTFTAITTIPYFNQNPQMTLDNIKLLLDAGADPNLHNEYSTTPLIATITSGYQITKLLLDNGADPNIPSGGFTALHNAVLDNSDIKVIKLLIESGANVNSIDYSGKTPIDYAISQHNYKALNELHKHSSFSHIDIEQLLSNEFHQLRQIQLNQMPQTIEDTEKIISILQHAFIKYKNIDYLTAMYDVVTTSIGLQLLNANPDMKIAFQKKLVEFIQQKPKIFKKYYNLLFKD